MKSKLLVAVAAAALFIGTAAVQAQTGQAPGEQQGGAAADQNTQGGGTLGGGNAGTGGVCPPEQCPQGAAEAPDSGAGTMPDGQAAQPMPEEAPAQDQAAQPPKKGDQPAERAAKRGDEGGQDQVQTGERKRNAQEEPATTGAIGSKAEISGEQRTEIRNTIVETHVEPATHVDFDINVGVVVPSTIVLHALPPRIIEIVPAYAGYEYFVLADGTIVIVEPGTLQIVYVIA